MRHPMPSVGTAELPISCTLFCASNRACAAAPNRALGVDLAQVTPTGPHGRIRREDVLHAAQQRPLPQAQPAPAVPATPTGLEHDQHGPVEYEPLSALRRTIAQAMVAAATTAVPVTTTDEADVTELVALRERSTAAAAAHNVTVNGSIVPAQYQNALVTAAGAIYSDIVTITVNP